MPVCSSGFLLSRSIDRYREQWVATSVTKALPDVYVLLHHHHFTNAMGNRCFWTKLLKKLFPSCFMLRHLSSDSDRARNYLLLAFLVMIYYRTKGHCHQTNNVIGEYERHPLDSETAEFHCSKTHDKCTQRKLRDGRIKKQAGRNPVSNQVIAGTQA